MAVQGNLMNKVHTPKHGHGKTDPTERDGGRAATVPLPVINPNDPMQSASTQAAGCSTCGDATCSSIGCPFGKDIAGTNTLIAKAGVEANRAFFELKEHSETAAREVALGFQTAKGAGNVPDYYTPMVQLFEKLAQHDAERSATLKGRTWRFMKQAYDLLEKSGGRGQIYGRGCPAEPGTCVSACPNAFATRAGIPFNMNEAALSDFAIAAGFRQPKKPTQETGLKVAFIGTGQTMIHAGLRLREKGHGVTAYDKNDLPGEEGDGKIQGYKVPTEIWREERENHLEPSGIIYNCGQPIGRDGLSIKSLANEFNAIVIATGSPYPREHGLTGSGASKVLYSNQILQAQQDVIYRRKFFDQADAAVPYALNMRDKVVGCNGNSDTAVDIARIAVAQNAREVLIFSRGAGMRARDHNDNRAWLKLYEEAYGEHYKDALQALFGDDGERLAHSVNNEDAASVIKALEHGMLDDSIQKKTKVTLKYHSQLKHIEDRKAQGFELTADDTRPGHEGEEIEIKVDMLVNCTGYNTGDLPNILELPGLPMTEAGTIEVQMPALSSKSYVNGVIGGFIGFVENDAGDKVPVFAGGDVCGTGLLPEAGKAGEDLAPQIDRALEDPETFYTAVEEEINAPVIDLAA